MRVSAEIDLGAVIYNMESMHRNLHPGTMMTAVVKTNGYGHGGIRIAQEVSKLPYLWGYAVATFEEAMELRDNGLDNPILILGYVFPYCYDELVQYEIRPAVFRRDMLAQLGAAAVRSGKKIKIHIAVDTGMSRIGIRPDEEGLSFVKEALSTEGVIVEGMFTHFAKADEEDRTPTDVQFDKFSCFADRIEQELGYRIPVIHCSNSAGIVSFPEKNMDMVRAGITLYGLWPSAVVPKDIVPLKPVMSLHSHIAYIKDIQAGASVSYGGTFTAQKTVHIATIPVGYGDGYPRSLSYGRGNGYVLIRGKKAPILGRVCMDQFMVCIDDIPEAEEGDLVTLIGTDGNETITMEQLGDLSGRFNYELACDINSRVPRVYKNSNL